MQALKFIGIIILAFILICAAVGIITSLQPKLSAGLPGIIFLICAIFFYFIPTIRAYQIKHRQKTPIFLINLTLGWTLIGWLIALIWSFSAQDNPKPSSVS